MDEPRTSPPPEFPVEAHRWGAADFRLVALLILLTLGLRTYQLRTTEVTAARQHRLHSHRLAAGTRRLAPGHPRLPTAPRLSGRRFGRVAAGPPPLPQRSPLRHAVRRPARPAPGASVLLSVPLFWLGASCSTAASASGRYSCSSACRAAAASWRTACRSRYFCSSRSRPSRLPCTRCDPVPLSASAGRERRAALAYLTRPEGLLIPAVAAATLLGMQAVGRWRRPWLGRAVAAGRADLRGLHRWRTLHGPDRRVDEEEHREANHRSRIQPAWRPRARRFRAARRCSASGGTATPTRPAASSLWVLRTMAEVFAKAFFYVFWLPALAGLVWFRDRFRVVPGAWMLLLLCLVIAGLLYRVAAVMGYLSDRHTILILLCGVVWATAALDGAARGLAAMTVRLKPRPCRAVVDGADGMGRRTVARGRRRPAGVDAATVARRPRRLPPSRALAGGAGPSRRGRFRPLRLGRLLRGPLFPTRRRHEYFVQLRRAGGRRQSSFAPGHGPRGRGGGEGLRPKMGVPGARGKETAKVVIYHLPVPWMTRPLP